MRLGVDKENCEMFFRWAEKGKGGLTCVRSENGGRVGKGREREREWHDVADHGNRFAAYERRCVQHSEYWWVSLLKLDSFLWQFCLSFFLSPRSHSSSITAVFSTTTFSFSSLTFFFNASAHIIVYY